MHLLGHYPEVQAKLHEEVDLVFEEKNGAVTSDDLKGLKYLECVLKECMRLRPTVPYVSRLATEDLQFGKYTARKGTTLSICIIGLNQNENVYPNPTKFDPERFNAQNSKDRHPYAYVPFSAGARNCIGQKFALLEEKTAMVYLLRRFQWKSTTPLTEEGMTGDLVLRNSSALGISFSSRQN